MPSILFPTILVIAATITYQFAQKLSDKSIPAGLVFTSVYFLAFLSSFCFHIFFENRIMTSDFQKLFSWPVIFIALGVMGIEYGFLYLYKMGAPLSTTLITTNAIVTMTLLLIGVFYFKEHLTLIKGAGLCLIVIGLYLLKKTS